MNCKPNELVANSERPDETPSKVVRFEPAQKRLSRRDLLLLGAHQAPWPPRPRDGDDPGSAAA